VRVMVDAKAVAGSFCMGELKNSGAVAVISGGAEQPAQLALELGGSVRDGELLFTNFRTIHYAVLFVVPYRSSSGIFEMKLPRLNGGPFRSSGPRQ
jgi:hypothetical protein